MGSITDNLGIDRHAQARCDRALAASLHLGVAAISLMNARAARTGVFEVWSQLTPTAQEEYRRAAEAALHIADRPFRHAAIARAVAAAIAYGRKESLPRCIDCGCDQDETNRWFEIEARSGDEGPCCVVCTDTRQQQDGATIRAIDPLAERDDRVARHTVEVLLGVLEGLLPLAHDPAPAPVLTEAELPL